MKKINFILLTIVITLVTECPVKSQNNFTDNFDTLNSWTLYGDPLPNHIDSIYGKSGVFDNNGDSWYNSGAISNQAFDLSDGFILESEVYVDFYNLSGCWADAEIGIADPEFKFWGGYDPYISIGLRSNGDACWVCPGITQRHAIITGGYKTSTGWETYGDCNAIVIFADQYANSWQILKIVVDQNRMPKFYIANTLIYSGLQPIDETVLNIERSIWLGTRSSGSAGKAYHNSVSLIPYVQENLLIEYFNDLNNWTLYGDPLPNHIDSIFGKTGVFDNNGDPNYISGAISKQTFDLSNGFILESEVYLDFYNLFGCWASAEIGIANPEYQSWGGYDAYISLGLDTNGDACWACPGFTQRHTLIVGRYKTSSGWESYGNCNATAIFADQYANSWQILKIDVDQNRMPKFYIADTLIYSGSQPIDETVLNTERSIWLGAKSSGSAGKGYHNTLDLDIFTIVPVKFISFTPTSNGKEVTLNWSTATELNNQGFEVQRKFGGNDFVTVGSVRGNGTTTTPNNYSFVDKLFDAGKYFYRLKQIDFGGRYEYSQTVEINWSPFTSYKLDQNYPNPFNPTTKISWQSPVSSRQVLKVFDVLGNEIATLVNKEMEAGYHSVDFNASELPSGIFFYRLQAGNYVETKKMLLLR